MRSEMIVGDPSTWPVAKPNAETVRVLVRPGVWIKMPVEQARAQGLLKEREPGENKERRASRNKGRTAPEPEGKRGE